MDRPELVQRILNKEITEAKMYEIIAAVSLCVETLSLEECRYLGERYFGIFHIVKGKVGVCCGSVEGFREVVEADNSRGRRAMNGSVVFVDEKRRVVCVSYMEGYKERHEDVAFEDMLAVHNPDAPIMKFENISGRSDLLIPE